jgi:hypothetical protein
LQGAGTEVAAKPEARNQQDHEDNADHAGSDGPPILLAYPGAQIFSFDGGTIREITYKETSPYQIVTRFLARPEVFQIGA